MIICLLLGYFETLAYFSSGICFYDFFNNLVDLIRMGRFLSFIEGSYLILNNLSNCWISSGFVFYTFFSFKLIKDFLLTSWMIIFLTFGLQMEVTEFALLKKIFPFLLLFLDSKDFYEQLLICDLFNELFFDWLETLE